jgi:hypothetical protein
MSPVQPTINPGLFDAVLFDLDGVLTSTAKIHARCWKTMFDDFLRRRAAEGEGPFRPFDLDTDYKLYVDGKPRYEGVRSFLASRNIVLSEGTLRDLPTADTVCGLGNRKDELVKAAIDRGEVEPYPGSVALVRRLSGTRHPHRGGVVEQQLRRGPAGCGHARSVQHPGGWPGREQAPASGKTRAGHLPRGCPGPGRQPCPRRGGGECYRWRGGQVERVGSA